MNPGEILNYRRQTKLYKYAIIIGAYYMKMLQEILSVRRISEPVRTSNNRLDREEEECGYDNVAGAIAHAHRLGKTAHHDGETIWDNPYPTRSKEWQAWADGFEQQPLNQDAYEDEEQTKRFDDEEDEDDFDDLDLDDESEFDEFDDDDLDELDLDDESGEDLEDDQIDSDDDLGDDLESDDDSEDGDQLDALSNQATEDPDKQGLLRKVPGAHLVYKRQTEEGTYEEMWVYNSDGHMKNEMEIRRSILAGTDIPVNKTESPDGKQTYQVWSAGNVEMLLIKGVTN